MARNVIGSGFPEQQPIERRIWIYELKSCQPADHITRQRLDCKTHLKNSRSTGSQDRQSLACLQDNCRLEGIIPIISGLDPRLRLLPQSLEADCRNESVRRNVREE
jgi:hypothetical protein